MLSKKSGLAQHYPFSPDIHPCTSGESEFCVCTKHRYCMEPPPSTSKNVRPCTFLACKFALQTCYCMEPPPSVAVLKGLLKKVLDTRVRSTIMTQQLSNSATQQLSNSATQQLSNSATQQLSTSSNLST